MGCCRCPVVLGLLWTHGGQRQPSGTNHQSGLVVRAVLWGGTVQAAWLSFMDVEDLAKQIFKMGMLWAMAVEGTSSTGYPLSWLRWRWTRPPFVQPQLGGTCRQPCPEVSEVLVRAAEAHRRWWLGGCLATAEGIASVCLG